ncbi:hypothetical protein GOV09_05635 [Candidatus Woesearchaeota archaeon]|nr:hypothetical protein [Candidatus Woesearchaeota archaeon]
MDLEGFVRKIDIHAIACRYRSEFKRKAYLLVRNGFRMHLSTGDRMILNRFVDEAIEGLRGISYVSTSSYDPYQEAVARFAWSFLGIRDAEALTGFTYGECRPELIREAHKNIQPYL